MMAAIRLLALTSCLDCTCLTQGDVLKGTKEPSLLIYKPHEVSYVDLIQLLEERVIEHALYARRREAPLCFSGAGAQDYVSVVSGLDTIPNLGQSCGKLMLH